MVFRGAAMVIFALAMVIPFLMTIASTKKVVFEWYENSQFHYRRPFGERTDKIWKPQTPSPECETPKMYIYTLSEKSLQYRQETQKHSLPF